MNDRLPACPLMALSMRLIAFWSFVFAWIFCLMIASHAATPANIVARDDFSYALKLTNPVGRGTSAGVPDVPDQENSLRAHDGRLDTKYFNKSPGSGFGVTCGIGSSVVTGIRFATANDFPERDPVQIVIEGLNPTDPFRVDASDAYTVLYEGSAGLSADPGRQSWGEAVRFANTTPFAAYRVLVRKNRGGDGYGTQYAELELLGVPAKPGQPRIVYAPPATRRTQINERWPDRARIIGPEAPAPADRDMLWYRRPADSWEAALPLGNGHLGAMLFGGVLDERIQLNDHTLWDGYPLDPANPKALDALPEVRRLLFAGQNLAAEKLAGSTMLGTPAGVKPYQTLGELWMETPGAAVSERYLRTLDLDSATARVSYESGGVRYEREAFVSAPADVMVVRFTADKPGAINLRLTLKRSRDARCEPGLDARSVVLRGQIRRADAEGRERGLKFGAQVTADAKGGSVTNADGVLAVSGADSLTLYVASATGYPGLQRIAELLRTDITGAGYIPDAADPLAECAATISRAVRIPYERLKADHVADYRAYYRRMSLKLDGPEAALPTDGRLRALAKPAVTDPRLAELYFNFGRYLLISSSRPGGLPANLQGLWAWQTNPPWNADYHTNINLQMNYWPAEVTNLSELHLPLFDLMDTLSVSGAHVAKVQYGARGWTVHHLTDVWGFAAPADFLGGVWPVGAAWLSEHPFEHYLYTGDRDFLARRAWPLMRGAARFVMDFLVEAPAGSPVAGRLVTNPSYSPENRFFLPDGKAAQFTYGATMDLMIVRELLENCVTASRILGVDADFRDECSRTLSRLAPVRVSDKTGRILEWIDDYAEQEPQHRHTSHLYGLHPSNQITEDTPELMAAARKVLERRGDAGTGWGLAWKINMWCRLGDGDHAHRLLLNLLRDRTYPNLFDAHPPFQIDGNFGATAAMAEMLLQSQIRDADSGTFVLQILPALPSEWRSGSVKGLRARGGFEVDIQWAEGRATKVRITSKGGRACLVRVGGKEIAVELKPEAIREILP